MSRQAYLGCAMSLDNSTIQRWEFIRRDGSRVPVLTGGAFLESKNHGVGFALDLAKRKRAEQALKQSEVYLAETQRLTHTGSWAYNYVRKEYTYYSDEQFRIHQ
jgi:hypothetical protein